MRSISIGLVISFVSVVIVSLMLDIMLYTTTKYDLNMAFNEAAYQTALEVYKEPEYFADEEGSDEEKIANELEENFRIQMQADKKNVVDFKVISADINEGELDAIGVIYFRNIMSPRKIRMDCRRTLIIEDTESGNGHEIIIDEE